MYRVETEQETSKKVNKMNYGIKIHNKGVMGGKQFENEVLCSTTKN